MKNLETKENLKGKTVFVGLSGGVDSSVSAFLLQNAGANVVGVFMKNWAGEAGLQLDCPWKEDMEFAKEAAKHLGIEFRSYNFEKEYKEEVMDYFFSEYKAGRTPNPDILCNSEIKFKAFMEKSFEDGADYIATGHYAKINDNNNGLAIPKDKNKDQTYFLSQLTKSQLEKIIFPLGHLDKEEVRKIAEEINLPNANRKDSQGICFIGDLDVQAFLRKYIDKKKGVIKDVDTGENIGEHDGIFFYTEGQREGLGIGGAAKPYYVAEKDSEKNILYAAMGKRNKALWSDSLDFESLHSIDQEYEYKLNSDSYMASIRYRGKKIIGGFTNINTDGTGNFSFNEKLWSPSPGQKIVFFDNDVCIGNATISKKN